MKETSMLMNMRTAMVTANPSTSALFSSQWPLMVS